MESQEHFLNSLGKKKKKNFERLLKESEEAIKAGKKPWFEETDLTVKDLLKLSIGKDVEFAREYVFDELSLRNCFPGQGCECKYFSSGKFYNCYRLSKSGVPVAQIRKRRPGM